MNVWLRRWGPTVTMMTLIFIASATPGDELPTFGWFDYFVKKGGHMTGYALLAASLLYAISNSNRITRRFVVSAIFLASLYAMTDEFHQIFTPSRTPSLHDVGIDTVGAAIGALLWMWFRAVRATYATKARPE
jgi:VanZ family protein